MSICFSHFSALGFWRLQAEGERRAPKILRTAQLSKSPVSLSAIRDAARQALPSDTSVHVTACAASMKCKASDITYHISGLAHPSCSFARLEKGVYVATPELVFLQLASTLQFPHLVLLGYELCGTYSPSLIDLRGFCNHEPLTSQARLASFCDRATGLKGASKARRAARFVLDNSASPRESVLAMILTLPRSEGGYALARPLLNYDVPLSAEQRRELNRTSVRCDACWPDNRLVVEYESDGFHSGDASYVRDSRRRNDLRYLNYDIATVTNSELKSRHDMDKIAHGLAKSLHVQIRPCKYDHVERQKLLRTALLDQAAQSKLPYRELFRFRDEGL